MKTDYLNRIKALTGIVPNSLVDFNAPRSRTRIPTQASSNVLKIKDKILTEYKDF